MQICVWVVGIVQGGGASLANSRLSLSELDSFLIIDDWKHNSTKTIN